MPHVHENQPKYCSQNLTWLLIPRHDCFSSTLSGRSFLVCVDFPLKMVRAPQSRAVHPFSSSATLSFLRPSSVSAVAAMCEAERPASASWSFWLPWSMNRSGNVMGRNLRLPSRSPSSARLCITVHTGATGQQLCSDTVLVLGCWCSWDADVRAWKFWAISVLVACQLSDRVLSG